MRQEGVGWVSAREQAVTNTRQETETPEMLKGRPQTSWPTREKEPCRAARHVLWVPDPSPVVFAVPFYTFLSSHAAADVKALYCHAVDLNLTSSPGDELNVGVKPRVSIPGSQDNKEMWLPRRSLKPVLEPDFGFQREKMG